MEINDSGFFLNFKRYLCIVHSLLSFIMQTKYQCITLSALNSSFFGVPLDKG